MHSPSDEESLFAEDASEGPSSSSSPSFPVAYSFADSFGSDRISSIAAKAFEVEFASLALCLECFFTDSPVAAWCGFDFFVPALGLGLVEAGAFFLTAVGAAELTVLEETASFESVGSAEDTPSTIEDVLISFGFLL